jgi:hypothetical protein
MFAAADERRERLEAELAASVAAHAARRRMTAAVVANMHEARRVLPTLAAVDPAAAWQTVWAMRTGTEDEFRYMLTLACAAGVAVWSAEAATEVAAFDVAADGDYLAPASVGLPAVGAPRVKRANGTVRGHIRRPVVGSVSGAAGDYTRLDSAEVMALTDAWLAMHDGDKPGECPALIGTDSYAWQEVHHSDALVTDDDMGDSLVGRGDRRIRLADKGTRVTYRRRRDGTTSTTARWADSHTRSRAHSYRPIVVRTLPRVPGAGDPRYVDVWAVHAAAAGRTDVWHTAPHSRIRFVDHGPAAHVKPGKATSRSGRAATVKVADMPLARADAAATIAGWCEAQHGTGATVSHRWHVVGVGTVTARHDHDRRSYRLTLTTDDNGKRVSRKLTDTRRIDTVATAITRVTRVTT